jgi:WhiB family redox-sensing transcriptional regulator
MDFNGIGYLEGFPDFIDDGIPLCAEIDPDIFFPVDHLEGTITRFEFYSNEREAKAICASCPFTLQCLAYALKNPDTQGIWGGTTQGDRRRMLRNGKVKNRQ